MSSPAPAREKLSGSRRGRLIAAALALSVPAAVALYFVGAAAPTGYVVLDPVVDTGTFLVLDAVTAGLSIGVAGWLVFRRGPAAITVRILTCLLAIAVTVIGGMWGLVKAGFADEVVSTEVIAVSPDDSYELILRRGKDWKNVKHDDVRVRSRAGLLSREADTDLADISCITGIANPTRIQASFTGDHQVTFTRANSVSVTVTFDDALRPTAFASFCPLTIHSPPIVGCMLLAVDAPRVLGTATGSRLRFIKAEKSDPARAGRRLLTVDDVPAFELSFWCGTCQFLFKRLNGATTTFSTGEAETPQFEALLPEGRYQPLLLQVEPRLTHPAGAGDYFAEEQVATWGLDPFWGLPCYPQTPYYRTFETAVHAEAHLYEFVVPMVPPSWNERDRVDAYVTGPADGATSPAVAVSILDVCAPAVEEGPDYYEHWALTHFLLDGHHRMQAAAETGRPVRLSSLLAVDAGLATADQIAALPTLRAAPPQTR